MNFLSDGLVYSGHADSMMDIHLCWLGQFNRLGVMIGWLNSVFWRVARIGLFMGQNIYSPSLLQLYKSCVWELFFNARLLFVVVVFFYCAEINIDYSAQILLLKLLQKFSKEGESTTEPGRRFHSLIANRWKKWILSYMSQCLSSIALLIVSTP